MFDIGFAELIVTCLVTLLVLGPKKLPAAIKFFILCTYKLRNFMQNISDKVNKEFDTDNIKLDIYNEEVMRNMQKNEQNSSNNLKDNDQNRS